MHIPKEKKMEILQSLLLARSFEDALTELCKVEGKIPGMMILCTGQEAVGAGVCAALAPEDAIITNHRSHSHLLSKGADPKLLMAEIFCKKTGYNKGKSGTLHLAVPEVNAPGGFRKMSGCLSKTFRKADCKCGTISHRIRDRQPG